VKVELPCKNYMMNSGLEIEMKYDDAAGQVEV